MKKILILLLTLFILTSGSGIGSAKELVVEPGTSIQTAVNNAVSGDSVIVKPGTYNGNIVINVPNLVIRSESGNPADTIIRANSNSSTVFNIAANNITVSGFKIESGGRGFYLTTCNGCTISSNELTDNNHAIYLRDSNYNKISANTINSNRGFGIYLVNSEGNTLLNNIANSNQRGIDLTTSNKNNISGNNVSYNNQFGMWVSLSNENRISGNTANENNGGIHMNSSSRNILSGNIVAFSTDSAFFECPGCHNNRIFDNYLNNIYNANIKTRDTIWNTTKTIGTNVVGGPYLGGNFWANPAGTGFSETAEDKNNDGIADIVYNSSNITDFLPLVSGSGKQQITLPVANFNTSNNSGYAPLTVRFNDLSVNAANLNWDFESDGIIDSTEKTPSHTYNEPGNYTARLTAVNANGTHFFSVPITVLEQKQPEMQPLLPVASFTSNVSNGHPPLSVQFTDASQYAKWRIWYFGDGATSNETNPTHVYTKEGNYNVYLSASNENGTVSKSATIIVKKIDRPGGKSGGGGGAGGSPEPQSNVAVKELSQTYVSSGKPVKFEF
ncbi:MAG: NosD domain-containing protein, partial [Methanosarcina sp.]